MASKVWQQSVEKRGPIDLVFKRAAELRRAQQTVAKQCEIAGASPSSRKPCKCSRHVGKLF